MSESSTVPCETERWQAVPNWEGFYEVSDKGRVRSVDRVVVRSDGHRRRFQGSILRQWTSGFGCPMVALNRVGERERKAVHLLVQEAFNPAAEPAPESERWLPVPGFEDWYEVSDLGRVRSYHLRGSRGRRKRPYLLTPKCDKQTSYLMVTLRQDGIVKYETVHTLVLTAFVGPRPPKNEARHGPNGRYDNSLANLCWGTMSENHQDRRRDGDPGRYRAKLTVAAVLECRERRAAGERLVDLAREFDVSSSGLCQAIKGVTWANV